MEEFIEEICKEIDFAYMLTGFAPKNKTFGGRKNGCLVTALARANGADTRCANTDAPKLRRLVADIIKKKFPSIVFPHAFVNGMIYGFDGYKYLILPEQSVESYQLGYKVGTRMFDLLLRRSKDAKPLLEEAPVCTG